MSTRGCRGTASLLGAVGLVGLSAGVGAQALRLDPVSLDHGIAATLLRVPLDSHQLSVQSVSELLRRDYGTDGSLQAVGRVAAPRPGAPYAVLSAGFSRLDPLEPAGGLVVDRRSLSPLSLGTRSVHGPGRVYALPGVLCVTTTRAVDIKTLDEYQRARGVCRWALQAGPIVVERDRRKQAIIDDTKPASHRLVACKPAADVRSFDFYYFENARLSDVERALRPRCEIALNLAGALQAGMTVWGGSAAPPASAGRIDTALPTVLLVGPKR